MGASDLARPSPASPVETGYRYSDAEHTCAHAYLTPRLDRILADFGIGPCRALDFGCGNGSLARWLKAREFEVVDIDPSRSGIEHASRACPRIAFHQAGSTDDLAFLGSFSMITCIEVIEHCYDPRALARAIHDRLEPGGIAILSTPYHGYLKNLALALSGRMDRHFTALWDGGHIKFFSIATLSTLLRETGFDVRAVYRAGRPAPFAKSMIAVAQKSARSRPVEA